MNTRHKKHIISNVYAYFLVVCISLFFPIAAYYIKYSGNMVYEKHINIPADKNGWRMINNHSNILNTNYSGADKIAQVIYSKENININYYQAIYYKQEQGKELISGINSIYDSAAWKQINYRTYHIIFSPYCGLDVNEVELSDIKMNPRLVWYIYNVAAIYTHNKYVAKLLAVWDIIYKKEGSQVLIMSTSAVDGYKKANDSLRRYIMEMLNAADLCRPQIF